MIKAPPSSSGAVTTAAPSSTAEPLANSTSVIMTTAVTLAGSCEAPYCSARLPARKAAASAKAISSQPAAGGGGSGARPCNESVLPSTPATSAPPRNMASALAASG